LFYQRILFFFLLFEQKKKNQKENSPTALLQLKWRIFFLSAARRPLRALIGAALLTEKDTPFLYAAPVRSG